MPEEQHDEPAGQRRQRPQSDSSRFRDIRAAAAQLHAGDDASRGEDQIGDVGRARHREHLKALDKHSGRDAGKDGKLGSGNAEMTRSKHAKDAHRNGQQRADDVSERRARRKRLQHDPSGTKFLGDLLRAHRVVERDDAKQQPNRRVDAENPQGTVGWRRRSQQRREPCDQGSPCHYPKHRTGCAAEAVGEHVVPRRRPSDDEDLAELNRDTERRACTRHGQSDDRGGAPAAGCHRTEQKEPNRHKQQDVGQEVRARRAPDRHQRRTCEDLHSLRHTDLAELKGHEAAVRGKAREEDRQRHQRRSNCHAAARCARTIKAPTRAPRTFMVTSVMDGKRE